MHSGARAKTKTKKDHRAAEGRRGSDEEQGEGAPAGIAEETCVERHGERTDERAAVEPAGWVGGEGEPRAPKV